MSQETDPLEGLSLLGDGRPQNRKDAARGGIQRWMQRAGDTSRAAGPWALVAGLTASSIAPLVGSAVGGDYAGLFRGISDLGSGFLPDAVSMAASRLKDDPSEEEWCSAIAQTLAGQLEHSQALQSEVAALLQSLGAIEATVQAAGESSTALARDVLLAVCGLGGDVERLRDDIVRALSRVTDELAVRGAQQRQENDRAHEQLVTMTGLFADLVGTLRRGDTTWNGAFVRPGIDVCPYPGLNSFEARDADFFTGRAGVVNELVGRITQAAHAPRGPLLLVGVSGVGKSSLLRAGVVPALRREESQRAGVGQWQVVVMTPTGRTDEVRTVGASAPRAVRPLVELAGRVGAASGIDTVLGNPEHFGAFTAATPGNLLIVVDQFEQVFDTATVSEEHRREFVTALVSAAPAVVLISVRADFYERCVRMEQLAGYLPGEQVVLGPMSPENLRQAVLHPAGRVGVRVEPALVELLLADLGVGGAGTYDPGSLPLLAHALKTTWQRRDGGDLTVDAYRAGGGISGAVTQEAEEVYADLNSDEQQELRRLLLRGVVVTGHEVTRRSVPRPEATGRWLDAMVERRLMTADQGSVQISHEALLWAWPRLAGWVAAERENLQLQQQLTEAVRYWQANAHDPGALYRGARLAAIQDWAADRDDLTPEQRQFIDASLKAAQQELLTEQSRTRRLRRLAASLVVLLIVAVGAGGYAYSQTQAAREQTALAQSQRSVAQSQRYAAQSLQAAATNPRQAKLLALRGWAEAQTPEARGALFSSHMLDSAGVLATGTVQKQVSLSPDGRWTATGGQDGAVRLWDNRTHTMVRELGKLSSSIWQMGFSPDGTMLSAGAGDKVQIWNVATGEPKRSFPGNFHTAWASDSAIILMTVDNERSEIGTWNVRDGHRQKRYVTLEPGRIAMEMAFSRENGLLALATRKGEDGPFVVKLIDVKAGKNIADLPPVRSALLPVLAFSPQGQLAFGLGDSAEVSFWDGRTGQAEGKVATAKVAVPGISSLVYSASGRNVLIAGGGVVRVWNVSQGDWAGTAFFGSAEHRGTGVVFDLAKSTDGSLVAATGANNTMLMRWSSEWVRPLESALIGLSADRQGFVVGDGDGAFWRQDRPGRLARKLGQGHGPIWEVARSPDGSIAAGSDAGEIIILDPDEKHRVTLNVGKDRQVNGLRFSDAGKLLFAGSGPTLDNTMTRKSIDPRLQVWDLTTLKPLADHVYPDQTTLSMSLSSNGQHLAVLLTSTSDDKRKPQDQILLYRTADLRNSDAEPYRTIQPPEDQGAKRAALSPDGRALAVGGNDGQIRLFDTSTGVTKKTFGRHPNGIRALSFSPDGATIATATMIDHVIRLWSTGTGALDAELIGHEDSLNRVEFAPDGKTLYSSGVDGTVGVWKVDPATAVRAICADLSGDHAEEDWRLLGLRVAESPCR
ncbi:WD40 repeat domain-containing protein [Kineosporia babensis]|uniref:Novel STAND NTPase 1 domain-containing protein n=1 Tax=Kineosporia babensis TaxID=499548 RepID=A0A9X1SSM3_9ACTN|nr:WD40 repeat domain-containing protein [Kineosporia babensis]MCD5310734.1 hypothetical protein [Kineosporia babensis]